jgi:tetratricopeptide (TPR) repeat protein
MDSLSNEQRQELQSLFSKIKQAQTELSSTALHKRVLELSKKVVDILPNDLSANKFLVTALIKSKQFEEATKLINALSSDTRKQFVYEHAYSLHRQGLNQKAWNVLQAESASDNSISIQHLRSQVNYKLANYQDSISNYEAILDRNLQSKELAADELIDTAVNYLACHGSIKSDVGRVEESLAKLVEEGVGD